MDGARHDQAVAMLTGLERFVRLVVERENYVPRGSSPVSQTSSRSGQHRVYGGPRPYTGLYSADSYLANRPTYRRGETAYSHYKSNSTRDILNTSSGSESSSHYHDRTGQSESRLKLGDLGSPSSGVQSDCSVSDNSVVIRNPALLPNPDTQVNILHCKDPAWGWEFGNTHNYPHRLCTTPPS